MFSNFLWYILKTILHRMMILDLSFATTNQNKNAFQ